MKTLLLLLLPMITGLLVRSLVDDRKTAGVYFYRMTAERQITTGKMLLLK